MAGWKLRKDKATAEEPGEESENAATATVPTETQSAEATHTPIDEEPIILDEPPTLPSFDLDHETNTDFDLTDDFTDIDFDSNADWLKKDDGSLTLVDYSEPVPIEPSAVEPSEPTAEVLPAVTRDEEPLVMEPVVGAPETQDIPETQDTLETPGIKADGAVSNDFLERLRKDPDPHAAFVRPASGPALSIPTVAPFVLDTPPAASPETVPQIVVRIGRLSATFALTKEVTIIGRPDSGLHYYPDIEIEMDDAVSRRHAEILKRADGFFLADAGSTNGTLLNGEALPAHEERLLAHGDHIRIGDRTEIIFE